ncbi:MAG: hypothetical protein EPN21_05260 [Methylococcaceae bacterium]|nr:MAG: hypothetical protein EPN21_05260 [Methylococcaceae bacterium]
MIRIALHLARTTRILLIAGLLLTAVGLTLARFWLLPTVDAYRLALQTNISQSLGQPLQIGGLSAHMRGFYPELVLRDVAVLDGASGAVRVRLGQIHVGLDLPRGLTRGDWRTDWITLQGADLALRRRSDGDVVLEGIAAGDSGLPPWLFGYGRFELESCRLRWQDESGDGTSLLFPKVDLSIVNEGRHHHLAADLTPPGADEERLRLLADVTGDMARPTALSGKLYLHGRHIKIDAWPVPEWRGLSLKAGAADFRLWADVRKGALTQLAGWVDLAGPTLSHQVPDQPDCAVQPPESCRHSSELVIAGLDGWFRWRREADGWNLALTRLQPDVSGSPWPESRLSLAYRQGTLSAAADYIRLDDVAMLLHALAPTLPSDTATQLDQLGLRGELRDLSLFYPTEPEHSADAGLCVAFNGLGWNATPQTPGVTGLAGRLCGNDAEAEVAVAAGPGALDLTRWFRAPQDYSKAEGNVRWRHAADGWVISSDSFRLQTPDLALLNRFKLTLASTGTTCGLDPPLPPGQIRRERIWIHPEGGGQDSPPSEGWGEGNQKSASCGRAQSISTGDAAPVLDWQARIEYGDMHGVPNYLPVHIMPPNTVAWLDAAFLGGRMLGGEARFQGPLPAFPFPNGEGIFQVRLDVADAELRFAKGWQPLGQLSAQLLFEGDGLDISNGQGRLGENQVSDLLVHIDHMAPTGYLLLGGRTEGSLPQVMDYFAQTPRAGLIKKIRDYVDADGHAAIDLLLGLDFADDEQVHVRGETRISDAKVHNPDSRLTLEGLTGSVRFDDDRFASDKLPAGVLGTPATLSLLGDGHDVQLSLEGRNSVAKLQSWQPSEAWGHLLGQVGYHVDLRFPQDMAGSGPGLRLDLTGDLTDAGIDLPPPFAKKAGDPAMLRLNAEWESPQSVALAGDYQGWTHWQTRLERSTDGNWQAPAGELVLAGSASPANAVAQPGWRISGQLGQVPLDSWWKSLNAHPKAMAVGTQISLVDLALSQPAWEGRELGAISVRLQRQPDQHWDGHLESVFATGNLRLPSAWPAPTPITLDMERLTLPDAPKATLERTREVQLDPTQLPTFDIHSRHLVWRSHDLGQLDCAIGRLPAGLRLNQCNLASPLQQIALEGEWVRAGGKDFSRLDGKIKIKDLGKLWEQLGWGDAVIDTPAKLKFALQWQDAPQRMAAAQLNGDLSVDLSQGSLRHIEPGVGRALGLFNIDTLKRRLLLDFSDVLETGLAYDKVRGEFKITDGIAVTHNLFLDGPSVRLFFNGSADLSAHTLDQLVTVMPRTSLAWPILGTLAGGPAVGAAVLLAQQLVGDKLEGITASQYTIKGGWDDPAVVLVSRNTPLDVLQRVWQDVKGLSGMTESEESKE